jgi:hypothetical protein
VNRLFRVVLDFLPPMRHDEGASRLIKRPREVQEDLVTEAPTP